MVKDTSPRTNHPTTPVIQNPPPSTSILSPQGANHSPHLKMSPVNQAGSGRRMIDSIDPDDPEYIKHMQRPADVKEDMVDMGARKRVSAVLNSKAFKQDLEHIIVEQITEGSEYPSSLIALHHLSEVLRGSAPSIPARHAGPSFTGGAPATGMTGTGMLTPWGSGFPAPALPINDIRGPDWAHISIPEKVLRCKLASLYRLVDLLRWSQGVFNHISVRISPEHEHFLLNPFGLLYSEVTASSLVKVNIQGEILDPGSTTLGISKAGFMIHSAVHAARPDLKCAIHCHIPSVVAISCFKPSHHPTGESSNSGILLPLSQEALICIPITGYHDYEGIALTNEERERLVRDIGPRNKILILKNHGLLACGSTIEEAFHYAFNVILACETQVKALSLAGGSAANLSMVSDPAIARKTFEMANRPDLGVDSRNSFNINNADKGTPTPSSASSTPQPPSSATTSTYKWALGEIMFEGYMRYMDSLGYKTGYPYKQSTVWRERSHKKSYEDIEIPPAAWSSGPYEYYPWDDKLFKVSDFKKRLEKTHWLNSPNAYQKIEVTEIGTTQPKKITKWVPCENGPANGTIIKEERDQYLAPSGTDRREFKKLHQEIKDNRRSDKLTAGPQSNVFEGMSWEEANKMQDSKLSGVGDQVIIMGAASKGIIDRNHQHNRQAYAQEYQKNPFDQVEYDTAVQDYSHQLSLMASSNAPAYSSNYSGAGPVINMSLPANANYYGPPNTLLTTQQPYLNGERGDVTDLSTTFRSTDGSGADIPIEERFNESLNISTSLANTTNNSAAYNNNSNNNNYKNSAAQQQAGADSNYSSATTSPTTASKGGKSEGGKEGGSKKKKSSLPGFRTPSFLKRKKSKERNANNNNNNNNSNNNNSNYQAAVGHENGGNANYYEHNHNNNNHNTNHEAENSSSPSTGVVRDSGSLPPLPNGLHASQRGGASSSLRSIPNSPNSPKDTAV